MTHKCGECKHWHGLKKQTYCRMGICDKVEAGTPFECDDGNTYLFDGRPFEDEEYDDVFECFEEGESNEKV